MYEPKEQIGVGAVRISDREKEYVHQVLESNRLSYGPFCRRLESGFAQRHDSAFCIVVDSGTAALQIGLAAMKEKYGWADGDEVICPAVTFIATSNTMLQNGLTPVFADVERDTYNIDPAQVERHITSRTRAIMVVHLYGQPCDMEPILAIAGKHGLRVIEDSAETMFARYRGKSVGSFGDVGCFSTYACHIMVTGVGGMCTTSDPDIAVLMRSIANHGRDSIYLAIDDDKGKRGKELQEIMEGRFRFVRMGYSYRMTELQAALGVAQLEDADGLMRKRRDVAGKLLKGLERHEGVLQLPRGKPDRDHSYMMFPLVIRDGAQFTREEITLFLEERMIETRHMVSILDQPYYRKLFGEDIEERYPVAKWIDANGFYIGSHPEMTDEVITYVLKAFDDFLARYA